MKIRLFAPASLAISSVLLVSLACSLPGKTINIPAETIPVTTEAVESLQNDVQGAAEDIQSTGKATLTIDEKELTSLIAFELQKDETPVLQDPQAFLRDGQVLLVGNVQQNDASVVVALAFTVSPDAEGRPVYKIVTAQIGQVPLPEALVNQFSERIDSAFESTISPRMDKIFIDEISIGDGVMTIQGHTR